jgi:hypothetical protein
LLLRTVPCIGRVVVLAAVSVRHTRTAARPERLPVGGILGPVRRTVPGTFWRAVPRRPGGTVAGALPVAGRCWARPWPLRLSRAAWTARSGPATRELRAWRAAAWLGDSASRSLVSCLPPPVLRGSARPVAITGGVAIRSAITRCAVAVGRAIAARRTIGLRRTVVGRWTIGVRRTVASGDAVAFDGTEARRPARVVRPAAAVVPAPGPVVPMRGSFIPPQGSVAAHAARRPKVPALALGLSLAMAELPAWP